MADQPFRTSLRRNREDPRTLVERINAQILERIEEALDMAALEVLVEVRRATGQPAPVADSAPDRREHEARSQELLRALRAAFASELDEAAARGLAAAEAGGASERDRLLAGQVYLARALPDYWQRLEAHRSAHLEGRLADAGRPRGLIRRLFGP